MCTQQYTETLDTLLLPMLLLLSMRWFQGYGPAGGTAGEESCIESVRCSCSSGFNNGIRSVRVASEDNSVRLASEDNSVKVASEDNSVRVSRGIRVGAYHASESDKCEKNDMDREQSGILLERGQHWEYSMGGAVGVFDGGQEWEYWRRGRSGSIGESAALLSCLVCRLVYRYLRDECGFAPRDIILFGRSIGTGIFNQFAATNQVWMQRGCNGGLCECMQSGGCMWECRMEA